MFVDDSTLIESNLRARRDEVNLSDELEQSK